MSYWSYSQLALYKKCPLRFKWMRVDKRPLPPGDGKRAFIGNVLQKTVERFYVEERWRDPANTTAWMLAEIPTIGRQYTEADGLLWNVGEQEGWIAKALDTVPKIVEVIKTERLLGVANLSEFEIEVPLGKDRIVGRADFLFEAPDGAITVLDGKAGGSFGKYVETDQLRLYALGVLASRYRRLPAKVGFWWYRFGKIAWKPVNRQVLMRFTEGVKHTIARVRSKDYAPTPGGHCRFCEWKKECPEGRAWLWRNPKGVTIDSEANVGTVGFE